MLASFETLDRLEFDKASAIALKIVRALTTDLANWRQITSTPENPTTPPDIASSISQNPFIKMEFLSDSDKFRIKSIIDNAQVSQQLAQSTESNKEFFVPIIPNRCLKLEVSVLDNTMWRIPCINHPPPIAITL